MRVSDRNTMGPAASEAGRAQETQKLERAGSAPSGAADSGGDRVEFSSSLGQLAQAISADGTQRAGRVQALAAAYQTGKYHPDSQATSQGMIAEAIATSHE
jgi:anti-sigma28 factor (negative regulator of flagellin synthesis)